MQDSFELMFRLGQKVQHYDRVRVEYYAPYLLKEATVQKVLIFNEPYDPEASEMPNPIHITEKFRFRTDKMCERESFPEDNRYLYS